MTGTGHSALHSCGVRRNKRSGLTHIKHIEQNRLGTVLRHLRQPGAPVTVTVTVTRRPGPAAAPVPAWPSGPPWQWLRVSHCRARDDPRAAPRARDSADSATVLVTPGSDRRPAAAAAGTERAAGAWAGLPSPGLGPGARPGLVARPRPGHNSVQDRGIIGPIQPGRATPPRWVSVSPAPPALSPRHFASPLPSLASSLPGACVRGRVRECRRLRACADAGACVQATADGRKSVRACVRSAYGPAAV